MRSHLETAAGHRTPEYKIWTGMITRCQNRKAKAFPLYGGRGIQVCDRWRGSYPAFLEDMGRRPSILHSLDRIDNDGPYGPENCRWADRKTQARNKRGRRRYVIRGIALLLCEWAERTGVPVRIAWERLQLGWTVERAIITPVQRGPQVYCQAGHLLAVTARYEGRSRRCTTCKRAYDAKYRLVSQLEAD